MNIIEQNIVGKIDPIFPERPDIQNLYDMPLKTDYRALLWYGLGDGTNLNLGFDLQDIFGRYVVLKSFSVYPYTAQAVEDFFVEDSGALEQWSETIPANYRINRVFDSFDEGTQITVLINGSPVSVFYNAGQVLAHGFPLDISLDNIYHKFPAKIQEWNIQINTRHLTIMQAGQDAACNVKVVCECYLL